MLPPYFNPNSFLETITMENDLRTRGRFHSPTLALGEIKAELFSILQTANFLKQRFDWGLLDPEFYFKRTRQFHQELIFLETHATQLGRTLLNLVENFEISQQFIQILQNLAISQDFHFNQKAQHWQLNPLELAAAASHATSAFITLLDYLQITEEIEWDFLGELGHDLEKTLSQYQIFRPIFMEVKNFNDAILPQLKTQSNRHILPQSEQTSQSQERMTIMKHFGYLFDQFRILF